MPALRALLVLPLLVVLSACSSGVDNGATSGVWSGTAEFKVDSLLADQNFRLVTDYETRYEFELAEDEDGLVLGYLNQYNTGTFSIREPRDDGSGNQTIIEQTVSWDNDRIQTWPVYGTFDRPTLELDLPEAEASRVFPKNMWTFTVVGSRARLEATKINHGYDFRVFENYDAEYTVILSPTNADEFSMERD